MDVWMVRCIGRWMDRWRDGWTDGQMDQLLQSSRCGEKGHSPGSSRAALGTTLPAPTPPNPAGGRAEEEEEAAGGGSGTGPTPAAGSPAGRGAAGEGKFWEKKTFLLLSHGRTLPPWRRCYFWVICPTCATTEPSECADLVQGGSLCSRRQLLTVVKINQIATHLKNISIFTGWVEKAPIGAWFLPGSIHWERDARGFAPGAAGSAEAVSVPCKPGSPVVVLHKPDAAMRAALPALLPVPGFRCPRPLGQHPGPRAGAGAALWHRAVLFFFLGAPMGAAGQKG